ncbi:MAG: pyruvate carboxyltransferase [Chloroflexi bacterium]|nr:pyruvate carboxyltransferase [Chloroflexota bacterium]
MTLEYTPRSVEIVDSTLREGQQSPLLHDYKKYAFSLQDKLEILRALILYGVKFIELFAPIVSPKEAEDFQALHALRDELAPQHGQAFLVAHVRAHPADVESALQAGFDGLHLYMGTSPQSQRYNHGKDLDAVTRQARHLLEDLRRHHPNVWLRFSGEDAFRTPMEDLFRVYDEIAPLVHRLGIPDTVGIATPNLVAQRIAAFRERYPETPLEVHFHDDRGFALPNALAAIRGGAQYVDTTILGLGERSGITSTTALLFNLFLEEAYEAVLGYQIHLSYPLNVLVADKLHMLVPFKEPVSLTNRTHTAGVHQGAVLRHASTYEATPLALFGVNTRDILLGPLSGWNLVRYFLGEIHGFALDRETARELAQRFKAEVYQRIPEESPSKVLLSLAHEMGLPKQPPASQASFQVHEYLHPQPHTAARVRG